MATGYHGTSWMWLLSGPPIFPLCPGPSYCRCPECTPGLALPAAQLGEHHMAARFGHFLGAGWSGIEIAVDGTPVDLAHCLEALAGPGGWVQGYTLAVASLVPGGCRVHPCACRRGLCQARIEGFVEVKMRASEALARAAAEGLR